MNTQTLKELGIERKKVPSNIRNEKSPLDFCSISDRSVSSGGTLLPWVSITALASLGAVKPTLGSKVPPLETLLPDMEKKSSGFFISDDGKRHCSTKGDIVTLFLRFISLLRKTVHSLVNEVSLIFGHFHNFSVVKIFYHH